MIRAISVGVAVLLTAAGCTSRTEQSAAIPGGQCFQVNEVEHWAEVGMGNFVVRTDKNEYFQSRVGGDCFDIDWAQEIAIQPRMGISQVCEGTNATILTRDVGQRPRQCTAFSFRMLTPAEVANLPERVRN